ncbi:MAG: pirin family protein [Leptospirales bacterium]|nr:pirin family protein [Leptospirales bacterium]
MPSAILDRAALAFPWPTLDPFLFCAHHNDNYPEGDERFAPRATLIGRNIGADFSARDGWSMYHGRSTPGFPQHPHRGFETITIARRGWIDHSDSLGAAARFGRGDVQWMTAGSGIVHSEMFPLLRRDERNPVELFQIWLNLPRENKMAAPYFSMYWSESVPRLEFADAAGRKTTVAVYAGALPGGRGVQPPPDSWAAHAHSEVRILTIQMSPAARWRLPSAAAGLNRALYFFNGAQLRLDGEAIEAAHVFLLKSEGEVLLESGDGAELLLLEGRPIGEPVAQYGPFVMNTQQEIYQAMADYERTRFGGWPWADDAPVHGNEERRFARHADGRTERPHDGAPGSAAAHS